MPRNTEPTINGLNLKALKRSIQKSSDVHVWVADASDVEPLTYNGQCLIITNRHWMVFLRQLWCEGSFERYAYYLGIPSLGINGVSKTMSEWQNTRTVSDDLWKRVVKDMYSTKAKVVKTNVLSSDMPVYAVQKKPDVTSGVMVLDPAYTAIFDNCNMFTKPNSRADYVVNKGWHSGGVTMMWGDCLVGFLMSSWYKDETWTATFSVVDFLREIQAEAEAQAKAKAKADSDADSV